MLGNFFVGNDLGCLGILALRGFRLLPLLARDVPERRRILRTGCACQQRDRCPKNENEFAPRGHSEGPPCGNASRSRRRISITNGPCTGGARARATSADTEKDESFSSPSLWALRVGRRYTLSSGSIIHGREPVTRDRRHEVNLHQSRRRRLLFLRQQILRRNSGPRKRLLTVRSGRPAHIPFQECQARTAGAGPAVRALRAARKIA